MVPGAGNPQAFNRYSYSLSNPLKYTDPSGHNPILVFLLIAGGALATYEMFVSPFEPVSPALGLQTAPLGVDVAEQHQDAIKAAASDQVSAIELAAGVAVQSPMDYLENNTLVSLYPSNSVGITQITPGESSYFEGGPGNYRPGDPTWAIQTMENKMAAAAGACSGCSATDRFIALGIGQNEGVGDLSKYMKNGSVMWDEYFAADVRSGERPDVELRELLNNVPSWKLANLRMFMSAIDQLMARGWSLPDGVDLDYARCIADQGSSCTP